MILLYCILLLLAINSPFILLYILRAIREAKMPVVYNPTDLAKPVYKSSKQRRRISKREKVSRNLNLLRILEGK